MSAPIVGDVCPWGTIASVERRARGVYSIETWRHGGLWLSVERVAEMPTFLREPAQHYDGGPWFERDVESYRAALAYPDLLPDVPTREALDVLGYFHPGLILG